MSPAVLLLAVTLAAAAPEASAQWLVSGLVTRHEAPNLNERHPGIGFMTGGASGTRYGGGFYLNSFSRRSYYLVTNAGREYGPWRFAVTAGAVSGYRRGIAPMVLPEVSARLGRTEFAAVVQPFHALGASPFVGLQVRHYLGGRP